MRDPMTWSFPLYRAFGIPVRVHVLFVVVVVGLAIRQLTLKQDVFASGGLTVKENPVHALDIVGLVGLVFFLVVLLHEYGHAFAGRAVGGEAKEILIWPLGGLATVETPQVPRAHVLVAAAGPAVNVVLCVALGAAVAGAGYVPTFAPLANPYVSEMRHRESGQLHTSVYGSNLYKPGGVEKEKLTPELFDKYGNEAEFRDAAEKAGLKWAVAPPWVVWLNRAFWLSWVLLLINLVPAYPLDGGQILQGVVWWRSDARQGTVAAVYCGFLVSVLMLVASIAANEAMLAFLAVFVFYMSSVKLQALESDEGSFGYDFSQGYTSLERDDAPPPPPRPQGGFLTRWRKARQARRLQRDRDERLRDDARMDDLLDKIARKEPLTDEEKRFMQRVSERYRNRS